MDFKLFFFLLHTEANDSTLLVSTAALVHLVMLCFLPWLQFYMGQLGPWQLQTVLK